MYLALYRRWRPKNFEDLVGQEAVSKILKASIEQNRIGHAYLFSGPRGTGKTSTAKILAKALNCVNGPTAYPCGECENCKKLDSGASMDVMEIDAASNRGIDEIRSLRDTVKFAPVDGKFKVYIIDEVHMLTIEAFNALLKTIEEPPPQVVFILATTEIHKVPATIKSRCQRYDFRRISEQTIFDRLKFVASKSEIDADDDALMIISHAADGGLRDALSILDQCAAINSHVTKRDVQELLGLAGVAGIFALVDSIVSKNPAKMLETIDKILSEGRDPTQLIADLIQYLRDLMIYKETGRAAFYETPEESLELQKDLLKTELLPEMLKILNETSRELRWSVQPRITMEVMMFSLIQLVEHGIPKTYTESDQLVQKSKPQSKIPEEKSKSNNRVVPFPNAAPSKSVDTNSLDGKKIWQDVLDSLQRDGKRMTFACMKNAEFNRFDGDSIVIKFANPIYKQIAESTFLNEIETLLKKLGYQLKFVCET